MAHTDERKQGVLDILYTKAGGNVSKCARLTGVDRKTIIRWQQEHEDTVKESESSEIPEPGKIQEIIIKRVYNIINTCNDPKKLMETYECLEKMKQSTSKNKETIFDIIEKGLSEGK
ncbi:MAG: helix-turn-helix domain-containing protein [Oscillibacter sp.]|nr:helix-turn-helix domain-containing protein [Oscillibacter sp.]